MADNGPPIPGYDRGGDGPPAPHCYDCNRYHWWNCPPKVAKERWDLTIDNTANGYWGKSPGYASEKFELRTYVCAACGASTRNPFISEVAPGYSFCCDSCAMRGPLTAREDYEKIYGKAIKNPERERAYRWSPPDDEYNPMRDGPLPRRVEQPPKPKKAPKKKAPEPKADNPLAARIGQLDFDDD